MLNELVNVHQRQLKLGHLFQVFREQAIDGETLPLLTEDHLLNNMGLKLGPALKIRSQVKKRPGVSNPAPGGPTSCSQIKNTFLEVSSESEVLVQLCLVRVGAKLCRIVILQEKVWTPLT